jgi:insertion element IS1 protein InsB
LRGVERLFDITRQTVVRWISTPLQKLPEGAETLLPASPDDILELDEVGSLGLKKEGTRWVWTAMCRRTRHIVAFALGDRSKATCLRLWKAIPDEYRHGHTFRDSWIAYQHVFPAETHQCVGKETGETAHRERWNTPLRQRMSRYGRQTLSFSTSTVFHEAFTKWFLVQSHRDLSLTL